MRKDISAIFAIIVLALGIFGLIVLISYYAEPAFIFYIAYPLMWWDYLNWLFGILGLIGGILILIGYLQENKKKSGGGLGIGMGAWAYFIIFSWINLITAPLAANMLNAIKVFYLLNLKDIVGEGNPFTQIIMLSILVAVHSGATVMEEILALSTYFLIIAIPSIPLAIISLVKT